MKRFVVVMTVWAMALLGVLASVVFPSAASATVGSGSFTSLSTTRVFDGTATTTNRVVQIAGLAGVPANATAVMVNTEVFAPTAAGYVRVTPSGQDSGVATQQFAKGQAISNLAAVKLVGGNIQVKVSAGSARILMDVSGYYSPLPGNSYSPLSTARVFDGTATTVNRQVQIAGIGGVPMSATAVMLNTEVFAPTAAGYVRVTPSSQDAGVATQQFVKGQSVSNLVAVKLVNGMAQVKVSAGSARVLMDVSGYYSAGTGVSYEPESTKRVFDGMANTTNRQVQIAGLAGVPMDATAVVVNTEVFAPTAAGYVRVTPASQDAGVATQQFVKGQAISNLVVVKLVGGKAQVKVSAGSARILMDVAGYYKAEDINAPGQISGLTSKANGSNSVTLTWTNPSDSDFAGVTIVRKVDSAPTSMSDGTVVTDTLKGVTSFDDNTVVAGTKYFYALFSHDVSGNHSAAVVSKGTDTAPDAPTASFTTSVLPGNSLTVRMTDTSIGAPTSWAWTFGDGTTSTVQHPEVTYTAAGDYTVTLIATSASGASAPVAQQITVTQADVLAPGPATALHVKVNLDGTESIGDTFIYLNWTNPIDADFTGVLIYRAEGTTAPAPTQVNLVRDLIDNVPNMSDVNLKPGTTYSYAIYAHDGSGNIAALDATGTVTATTTNMAPPIAVLASTISGEFVEFDASGSTPATGKTLASGTLNFGDGSPLEAISGPEWLGSHSYAPGTYTAILKITDSAGISSTTTQSVVIGGGTVGGAPTITGPASVAVGVVAEFTLTGTGSFYTVMGGPADFYFSGFGNPPATVTYTFTDPGDYIVSLIIDGVESTTPVHVV